MRKLFVALAALIALSLAAPAAAQVIGPSPFPAPGGTTFTPSGSIYQSTRVGTYSGFDLSATGDLYFTLTSHGLSMDGAIDEAGETLVYDAATSNLTAGIVNYIGFTNVIGSSTTYQTRLLLAFTDVASGNPLALTYNPAITTDGPLLLVSGDYRMTGGFQVLSGSTWVNADTFYNNAPFKPAGAEALRGSLGGSFYYTAVGDVPEPATWAMMLLGFGGIGATMRRQRKSTRLAQVG